MNNPLDTFKGISYLLMAVFLIRYAIRYYRDLGVDRKFVLKCLGLVGLMIVHVVFGTAILAGFLMQPGLGGTDLLLSLIFFAAWVSLGIVWLLRFAPRADGPRPLWHLGRNDALVVTAIVIPLSVLIAHIG
ncbi:MAG: hypothetical protein ABI451_00400 [Dokdonella sp.]